MKRYIITALCAFVACWAWGQLTYPTNIGSVAQLQYQIVGDSCVELSFNGAEMTSHPLQPEVPIFYYTFVLPPNSIVREVKPSSKNTITRGIPYPIKCSPPLMTTNGDVLQSDENEVPQYLTDVLYVVSDGYFDGDIHLVTIAYSPISYIKRTKSFTFTTIPQIKIYIQQGNIEGNTPITPRNRNHNTRVAMIQQMVNNPSQAIGFVPQTPTISTDSILMGTSAPLPGMGYEYLIITTRNLCQTAQKLVDWKRSKGIHAGVVCYEDICDMEIIDTQSQYTEIDDAAGHLRKYLRNAHANGLQYAFLVAERGVIPYRRYYHSYSVDNFTYDIPTDFYYTELNNQWNSYYPQYNSYSFTGNILPDIAVGRLFVSDNEEWSSYIDRLITYERNPGHGNPNYLGKYFTIQSDQMQRNNSGHASAEILNSCFSNIQTWNEQPSYNDTTMSIIWPKGKDVIDELQNNPCGYFATYAHGGQMSVTTFSGGVPPYNSGYHIWAIRSVENDTITNSWDLLTNYNETKLEPGAGIDNLNLPQNPFIVYSMSCTTMPYDTVLNSIKTPSNPKVYNPITVGVAFTAKSKSAVAYIGNTREGWIGPSDTLHSYFNKVILDGITNIGNAENISKMQNHKSIRILSATHNILGCPEIPIWTAIPQKITDIQNSDLVKVTPLFCNNAPQQKLYSEVTPQQMCNHSIAKISQNYYPFYLPIYLKNVTLQSKHTLFSDDVIMGDSDISNAINDYFVIGEQGSLTIETTGTVKLCPGTIIKEGGTLTIKHTKQ